MIKAKRGRGSHRGVYSCAIAALGIALWGCGGAAGRASARDAYPPTASIGAVTLNWMPPTINTDGTPLTNLAGYDIHYGTSPGRYTHTINISNPGIATYVIDNLTPGTYYFTVTAVDSQGTESPLSSPVTMTVE